MKQPQVSDPTGDVEALCTKVEHLARLEANKPGGGDGKTAAVHLTEALKIVSRVRDMMRVSIAQR